MALRAVTKVVVSHRQKEGGGFIVRRPIGGPQATDAETDPFLLCDELGPVHYGPGEFEGAPPHPHRGFEAVLYMKHGAGRHNDSMGVKGTLEAGGVGWTCSASGIIHEEGKDHPGGLMHAFQTWINLPARHKMDPPSYQELTPAELPAITASTGVRAKVLAGTCAGHSSPMKVHTPIQLIHFDVDPRASYTHAIPPEMETALCYMYAGERGNFCGREVKEGEMTIHGRGSAIQFTNTGSTLLSFVLMAGVPLREPVVRGGPFVMNSQAEIHQAFADYRNGTLVRYGSWRNELRR
mmetsp:Transcript_12773/g.42145  ORF Transcript_12773/g.42145 Transcript_12773/m.42145 type:complete len:294 (-) Transcript_12773:607-1488(-)